MNLRMATAVAKSGAFVFSASVLSASQRMLAPSHSNFLSLVTGNKAGLLRYVSIFTPSFPLSSSSHAVDPEKLSSSIAMAEPAEQSPSPRPVDAVREAADAVREAADALDIRVGRIIRAWRHPEADSLYVEEVDVGEAEPRTICSGLVNYVPLDNLQDIKVVVLANLKPRNMRGIKSNGMLMAASDAPHETVELLLPPVDSVPGERIWFGSEEDKDKQPAAAAAPNQVQKKKIWEFVQPHLKTSDGGVAALGHHPMRTSAGVITCRSLKNANIS